MAFSSAMRSISSALVAVQVAALMKKVANNGTDADVQAEYDKFVAANGGKEYRARHILVETKEQAEAILASLKKGGKGIQTVMGRLNDNVRRLLLHKSNSRLPVGEPLQDIFTCLFIRKCPTTAKCFGN